MNSVKLKSYIKIKINKENGAIVQYFNMRF